VDARRQQVSEDVRQTASVFEPFARPPIRRIDLFFDARIMEATIRETVNRENVKTRTSNSARNACRVAGARRLSAAVALMRKPKPKGCFGASRCCTSTAYCRMAARFPPKSRPDGYSGNRLGAAADFPLASFSSAAEDNG